MIIWFSALIAVVGAIIFLLAKPPDPKELGRIMFFNGLLVFLLVFQRVVHLN